MNPDIRDLGNNLPAGKRRRSTAFDLPEMAYSVEEEMEMGLMRKQMLLQQRASFEQTLKERLAFLSGKGVHPPKADKDTIARKLKADIRAVNKRLRKVAENDKRTEELAKIKSDKAAAPQKEREVGKGDKPKKEPEAGKGKKVKAEGGKSPKTAEPPGEGKAEIKKSVEGTRGEPAGQVKTEAKT